MAWLYPTVGSIAVCVIIFEEVTSERSEVSLLYMLPCPVRSHVGEYEGYFSQMSSSHFACISVPLAMALDITPLLAPMVRSIVPMEIPSESAKSFSRDKILHMMRKYSMENFVVRKLSLTFAACSKWNERSKVRKRPRKIKRQKLYKIKRIWKRA